MVTVELTDEEMDTLMQALENEEYATRKGSMTEEEMKYLKNLYGMRTKLNRLI
jgi:hypothetical protein